MPGPPFSDRAVPFSLAHRMSQVNISETDYPHSRRLDHRHSVPGGIDHGFPQTRAGQRLAFMLVICQQPGRGGLAATQDRGDQLIAERAGKGKFNDRQVFQRHESQPNEILERAAVALAGTASGAGRGPASAWYVRPVLDGAPFIGFIPVRDIFEARGFYERVLGLRVAEDTPFALVLDANGTMLRVTPVPDLAVQSFTIAGWRVDDIVATVRGLEAKGVRFTRYDGMGQDEAGIWTAPSGDKVAWFTDPDGNTLSLTEFAT
jgi:catechol 2,3-dioxygenase-like lactoylglutathione lyase family enzyme